MADAIIPPEEWRAIPGWPSYEASSLGRIRRVTRGHGTWPGRVLKPTLNRRANRYFLHLCDGSGARKLCEVHRLICITFHGSPPSPKHEAAHWDGDSTSNTADNLRWATRVENEHDKRRHGRDNSGERNGSSKLTEEQVRQIRRDYRPRIVPQSRLAAQYGVARESIRAIVRGTNWKHLT
jgi:hypothetical protein